MFVEYLKLIDMKRNEIRIVNLDESVFDKIKKRAKENKRTIGKEAEYCIERYLLMTDAKKEIQ